MSNEAHLSRRERQIMDVLHQRRRASAAEVLAALPDAPGYSAVRALLRILEEKGHIKHRREGACYVYLPLLAAQTDYAKRIAPLIGPGQTGDPRQAGSQPAHRRRRWHLSSLPAGSRPCICANRQGEG